MPAVIRLSYDPGTLNGPGLLDLL